MTPAPSGSMHFEAWISRSKRRDGGDHGPERLRQDDTSQLPLRLDSIDGGEVLIEGTPLSEMSDRERTDYRAAHGLRLPVLQPDPGADRGRERELPLLVARVPGRGARSRARRSTSSALQNARITYPTSSGGERQRVTIARSLVNEPAIVWADEPTGDLDSENAAEIVALMRRLNLERGLSFLIVTHDISVGRKTDRIVRMLDGEVVEEQRLEVSHVLARHAA